MDQLNLFHQESLSVSVHTEKQGTFDGVVVETMDTTEGFTRVVTDFPRNQSPRLPIGDDAALVFTSSAFAGPMQASGRVYMSSEDHFRHRYLFEFKASDVAPVGYAVNQRRASRVYPDPSNPVKVDLFRMDEDDAHPARMHDLSVTGIGAVIPRETEVDLFSQWTLRLHFELPDHDEQPFNAVGIVRNRKLVDDGIHYGIEFDPNSTPNFEQFQQRLITFIMSRQAESFRRARVLDRIVQGADE